MTSGVVALIASHAALSSLQVAGTFSTPAAASRSGLEKKRRSDARSGTAYAVPSYLEFSMNAGMMSARTSAETISSAVYSRSSAAKLAK